MEQDGISLQDGIQRMLSLSLKKANEIVADSYMGTGASMSLDDVFNSVKVNCNYYNVDDLIPDLFEDDYLTNRHGENAVHIHLKIRRKRKFYFDEQDLL